MSVSEDLAVVLVAVPDELLLDAAQQPRRAGPVGIGDEVGEDVDHRETGEAGRGRAEDVDPLGQIDREDERGGLGDRRARSG